MTPKAQLNTGAEIPLIGLGTWQSLDNTAILNALKAGYRHLDTAATYLNEREVGKAIKESGIPREELFVTTKIPSLLHRDPAKALDLSLNKLGTDYVDLLLIHWPVPIDPTGIDNDEDFNNRELIYSDNHRPIDKEWNFIKTWELMQGLPKSKVRAIGVSNFSINNLKQLLDAPSTTVVPAVNQIEIHPRLPQVELIEFSQSKGIVIEAYSPLGSTKSPYWENTQLKELAGKYGVNVGQFLINWGLARGYVVLPKSANEERLVGNLVVFDLDKTDVDKITEIGQEEGEYRHAVPTWDWPLFQ